MKLAIAAGKLRLEVDLLQSQTAKAIVAALPFGRTPISTDARPKLASRCNVIGRLDDFLRLASVKSGDKVCVEAA